MKNLHIFTDPLKLELSYKQCCNPLPQPCLQGRHAQMVKINAKGHEIKCAAPVLDILNLEGFFKLRHWLKRDSVFAGPGMQAVPPRHTFQSWRTSLLCIMVELAGKRSVIHGATPTRF